MSDPAVSNLILRQLGGNPFLAMTGARDLVYDDRSLTMRLTKAKNGICYIKVALTDADLYELKGFGKDGNEIPGAILDDIANFGLAAAFEALTGLRTML